MIDQPLDFGLPKPWSGLRFHRDRFGEINFLVGPNGSGKSRFASALRGALPGSRLLGTDRLSAMSTSLGLGIWGDNLANGYQKNWFPQFKSAGITYGSGVDTFILLEERPDLRVMVEATLSSLFNRSISIEWDSGNLVPRATTAVSGDSYRVDREECHGIRELLVLLTHLYNDECKYLIVDEPELNLHPQYQSFFMQEVRTVAGDPNKDPKKKAIFLITHSPFIIDLRCADDLASIMSFSADYAAPVSLDDSDIHASSRIESLIPRLNVHHKQLFFSDNPIFVEGILDAQMLNSIQERRNVSIPGAGSCLIDVGGCETVNKYLELCRSLRKSAYFLYDLDSLFTGNLRQCIGNDGEIAEFLATLGFGSDFGKYCGQLDRLLTDAVRAVRAYEGMNNKVNELRTYIESLVKGDELINKDLARARVAVLVGLAKERDQIAGVVGSALAGDIEGRLAKIVELLATKNVFLLPGGSLENYLPFYAESAYSLDDELKRKAVEKEVLLLASGEFDDSLASRYGALFDAVRRLPGKPPVDTDAVLLTHLGDYVYQLQSLVLTHTQWGKDQLSAHFASAPEGLHKLFEITEFVRHSEKEFAATIRISRVHRAIVRITHETNAGMRRFTLEDEPSADALLKRTVPI